MSAKVLSNLESVGDLIGSLKGMGEAMEEDEYIETLIQQAHGKAANAFDVAAAATAGAGHLTHVFEFGVPGITRGQPKFADPTAPEARLWIHRLSGKGGNQDIGYTFRPATQPNPQPTTAETGVASKYLRKLSRRKYIFWNKAFVMETGQTVSIKAKNSDFLFIPFGDNPPTNPANKRGFVMYNTTKLGPISAKPGASSKGTFTAFWMNWWASAGNELIEQDMRASVESDIKKAEADIAKRTAAESMKPVQATNIIGSVNTSRSWMKKLFGAGRKVREIS